MRPRDTSQQAHEAQLLVYRRLTPEARVAIAAELSEGVRLIASEGIRSRHPEYSEVEVKRALMDLIYGKDLAQRVWPRAKAPVA